MGGGSVSTEVRLGREGSGSSVAATADVQSPC